MQCPICGSNEKNIICRSCGYSFGIFELTGKFTVDEESIEDVQNLSNNQIQLDVEHVIDAKTVVNDEKCGSNVIGDILNNIKISPLWTKGGRSGYKFVKAQKETVNIDNGFLNAEDKNNFITEDSNIDALGVEQEKSTQNDKLTIEESEILEESHPNDNLKQNQKDEVRDIEIPSPTIIDSIIDTAALNKDNIFSNDDKFDSLEECESIEKDEVVFESIHGIDNNLDEQNNTGIVPKKKINRKNEKIIFIVSLVAAILVISIVCIVNIVGRNKTGNVLSTTNDIEVVSIDNSPISEELEVEISTENKENTEIYEADRSSDSEIEQEEESISDGGNNLENDSQVNTYHIQKVDDNGLCDQIIFAGKYENCNEYLAELAEEGGTSYENKENLCSAYAPVSIYRVKAKNIEECRGKYVSIKMGFTYYIGGGLLDDIEGINLDKDGNLITLSDVLNVSDDEAADIAQSATWDYLNNLSNDYSWVEIYSWKLSDYTISDYNFFVENGIVYLNFINEEICNWMGNIQIEIGKVDESEPIYSDEFCEYHVERVDKSFPLLDFYYDEVVFDGRFEKCNDYISSKGTEFITNYEQEMEEYSQTNIYGEEWSNSVTFLNTEFFYDNCVSIKMAREWYMGGAYSYDVYGINLDTDGNEITLADIFDISEEEAALICENATVNGIRGDDDIYFAEFAEIYTYLLDTYTISDYNFYIENGIIYLTYAEGEICASSWGNITVEIGALDFKEKIIENNSSY